MDRNGGWRSVALHGRQLACVVSCALILGAFASGCRTAGPRLAPAGMRTHTVAKGETLWSIAQRYDSSVHAISRANGLSDPRQIRIGQQLRVPAGVKTTARDAETWTRADPRGRSGTVELAWPLRGTLTSGFGWRSSSHHDGIDIAARRGTRIRAAESGRVIHADNSLAGYGNLIILKHAGKLSTVYAHNDALLVRVGQFVERGQIIAHVGNTGRASAPHLHFEVRRDGRPGNPLEYLP